MSLRVSLVIGSLESLAGGTEQHLRCLVEGLPRRGFEIDVVSVLPSAYLDQGSAPFPVHVLAAPSRLTWRVQAVSGLRRRWLRRRPAVAVSFFDNAQFAALGAALMCGAIPVLAARRNLGVLRAGHSLMEIRMLDRGISRFVCNSEAVRRDVLARERVPAGRTVVLYNGIETTPRPKSGWRARRGIPPEAVLVACLSGQRAVKGVDLFLRAFGQAARDVPEARAVLIGDGPEQAALRGLSRDLGIQDRVLFEGACADPRSILAECQIGALGSRSEGFSTAVIEYMAEGLASVLTDVGGNSEAVRDGQEGYLIRPADHAGFARQLTLLLRDGPGREAMGSSAQARARLLFDREVMLDRMAQILREVAT